MTHAKRIALAEAAITNSLAAYFAGKALKGEVVHAQIEPNYPAPAGLPDADYFMVRGFDYCVTLAQTMEAAAKAPVQINFA